jgi:pantoate--beta-alanine ligase
VTFVPTMGALHDGHRRLIERAVRGGDRVIVSIFVNPRQFGPGEDYEAYPRVLRLDRALCGEAGAHLLYVPRPEGMYPEGFATTVQVGGLGDTLCGPFRPGHFEGVTTVVLKLLNRVAPDRMILGQKDAQQAAILRRMIADLDLPVRLDVAPTIRDRVGLAMSSRTRYLSEAERRAAPALHRALAAARRAVAQGEGRTARIIDGIRADLDREPLIRPQYIEVVDYHSLKPAKRIEGKTLIALAAHLGRARLIDNVVVTGSGPQGGKKT